MEITVSVACLEVFDKEAELLKQDYELKEQEWFEKHGDTDYATDKLYIIIAVLESKVYI